MERQNPWQSAGILALAMGMLVLAACGADCGWTGRGEAWIDQNENGTWDSDEAPLAGVLFRIYDARNDVHDFESVSSAQDGSTVLSAFLPGCPKVKLEVYVDMPTGYRLTTEPRVQVRDDGDVARFGFVPVK